MCGMPSGVQEMLRADQNKTVGRCPVCCFCCCCASEKKYSSLERYFFAEVHFFFRLFLVFFSLVFFFSKSFYIGFMYVSIEVWALSEFLTAGYFGAIKRVIHILGFGVVLWFVLVIVAWLRDFEWLLMVGIYLLKYIVLCR